MSLCRKGVNSPRIFDSSLSDSSPSIMLNPWARIESIDSVMFVEFKIGCPFISLMAK